MFAHLKRFQILVVICTLVIAFVGASIATATDYSGSGNHYATVSVPLTAGTVVNGTSTCTPTSGVAYATDLSIYSPTYSQYFYYSCNNTFSFTATETGSYTFNYHLDTSGGNNFNYTLSINAGAPDDDSDGIPNSSDNCLSVSNATQLDTDGDGKGDACDAFPLDAQNDADGDTVSGHIDNCPTTANADQTNTDNDSQGDACDSTPNGDTDSDGIDNKSDNCQMAANPGQEDTDGDKIGNACDLTPNGDDDLDGIDNTTDNCPTVANASQEDVDGDKIGNACDLTPNGDTDGDTLDNNADNCPTVANLGQEDVDMDGKGDACDSLNEYDVDADSTDNIYDNCPTTTNADQADVDADGAGDKCDPYPANPYNEAPFVPGDSRLNQHPKDRAASAAVYCQADGLQVWSIEEGHEPYMALNVTQAQIDAVGVPAVNTLIASADVHLGQVSVWRLTTGEFQVMAPGVRPDADAYQFIWNECHISQ